MKWLCKSSSDRISKLPANVIERILQLLPIEDAAKMGRLSTQWWEIWAGIPKLVLNGFLARIPEDENYSSDSNRLMLNMYKALMLHDAKIEQLVLEFPGLTPSSDIDHMILYISKKGVLECSILFSEDEIDCLIYSKRYRKVPNSLFSARQLERLKLQCCEFQAPSWFLGFDRLTFLDLKKVYLGSDFFSEFLPEWPSLKSLTILECDSDCKIEFMAPSLQVLIFESNYRSICFKNTPLLSVVSILEDDKYSYKEENPVYRDITAVFASLPAIEELIVGIELFLFCTAGHVPHKLPTELLCLKELVVSDLLLNSLPEARDLVCLIMSSPNLHKLTIVLDVDDDDHQPAEVIDSLQMLLEAEEIPATCLQCLEEFSMHECCCTSAELELLRFVLATAPMIRKVFIEPEDKIDSSKGLDFLMKVTQCKRASKEAEVIYLRNE